MTLLALCLVILLVLGYVASQQGQQSQTQNENITGQQNQTQNQNASSGQQNQTQNGNTTIAGQQNQTQNQNNNTAKQNQTQNGNITIIQEDQTQHGGAAIANPASIYCVQNGGVSRIVTAVDGSQRGVCVLANGTECDDWAYYRGECYPRNCNNMNCSACTNSTDCNNQTNCQWNAETMTCNIKPPVNIPNLDESDFIVVDDSMPNFLTSQKLFELPPTAK